ncbi:MAG: Oxidoreductase, NAD-binding domain protein [candidate division TM6 bacterium GW2011_GWF2_38_10]|nr:MAG: Oxidoreductase, NAD-binding domain protein [candidate division TM6 bacterium GW2011_GWF2_38_10]
MQQIFLQKGKVLVQQVSLPVCPDKGILVRVYYSFVSSGTEGATLANSAQPLLSRFVSNIADNTQKVVDTIKEHGVGVTLSLIKNKSGMVMPLGYSCSGQVMQVGSQVKGFRVGDYVACAGAGIANHAEVVAVPQNLAVRVTDPEKLKQASITTIGAIALQGIRRAGLQLGEKVCVVGLGLLGQLTVQLAKRAGCYVIGVDIQESRIKMAQQLGADCVLNASSSTIEHEIAIATGHIGVDVTIITAASSQGALLQQAMEITRRKGKVVLVGDVAIDFDRDPFYSKEIDFLISCSYGPGRYDDAYEKDGQDYPYAYVRWTENRNMELFVQLVQQGDLLIDPLITQTYALKDVEQAYASLATGGALGLVLEYDDKKEFIAPAVNNAVCDMHDVVPFHSVASCIGVACVGAGGFAKVKLLPLLAHTPGITLTNIVDTDPANARNVARQYGVACADNDFQRIVRDEKTQALVIATPHGLHAEQAIMAMRAGKAVFIEKPAAVTNEQYQQLLTFLRGHKDQVKYCVDFNRSFAPYFSAIGAVLEHRTNPVMINYRMNAGYIPQNHWIHGQANRGRIIGEACHIFELFCSLTRSYPVTVSVYTPLVRHKDYAPSDNFTATFYMADGSVCSLLYTALGDVKMGKERAEVFFDGKSIIMDDFIRLSGFGVAPSFDQVARKADRGHACLIEHFFASLRDEKALPIAYERILMATKMSLVVDVLASSGGGIQTFERDFL